MSSSAFRPGVVAGFYPERQEPGINWLEGMGSQLSGLFARRAQASRSRLQHIAERVEKHGDVMSRLRNPEVKEMVYTLRQRLLTDGLVEEPVAQCFALVRELAERELGMRHFDTQLMGGWVMLSGMLAEMETGEGKTLTATLPACTAALAGIPVHIVTVNDYLATRDATSMRPLYEALGLTVGTITAGMEPEARRAAYACDVTYCTNKEVAFDYLRDRITLGNHAGRLQLELERLHNKRARIDRLLMRGLCFAIVDEADSVLIDEARTPLIISRPGDNKDQIQAYGRALDLARRLEPDLHFHVRGLEREVVVTGLGRTRLAELASAYGGIWSGSRRREELVQQALVAQCLYVRDRHYLVRDDTVQIIDENTGRVMPGRSWERGLHQMIETKEGCSVTAQNETVARLTYQRFFRRYLRLSGMTGTAREVAGELRWVYRLNVVTLPTHRPLRRTSTGDRIYRTAAAKWSAIVERVRELHRRGRPVLVGTRSVADSEHLSGLLTKASLVHQVLNARQDKQEAEIIARAGEAGCITVATNMAGRGTDIRLALGVEKRGGLHVIAAECNEAHRIDRQLFGRCGRQGDRGSYESILSFEDDLPARYCPSSLHALAVGIGGRQQGVPHWIGRSLMWIAQRAAEWRHRRDRRHVLKMDEQLNDMLAFSGRLE